MRQADLDAIRQLEIFRQAAPATTEALVGPSFYQRFPPGVLLVEQNTMQDFLYVLVEGQVEMFASSHGKETVLEIVEPVGLFILAAILNDDVCLQSGRTLKESRVLMIPGNLVREAMTKDLVFMRAVVTDLAKRYRTTIKELKNQKLRNSTQRLANWLLAEATNRNNAQYIDMAFEKRLLASRLGMTPENLSRALATLHQHGVTSDGSRIIFTDKNKLIAFAEPDELIDNAEIF